MPHFTLTIDPRGPIVQVAIMPSAARTEQLTLAGLPAPPLQHVAALLDTGASGCLVDPSVLEALQLDPTGTAEMITPSTGATPVTVSTYDVCIGIFAGRPNDMHFIAETVPVMTSALANQGFHVILGRDLLSRCILHYNGADGVFTLAY